MATLFYIITKKIWYNNILHEDFILYYEFRNNYINVLQIFKL